MNEALGMVEVIGYACAVSVADTMVKTAAVDIQGLQRAKGSGWLTIKVTGSVAAVEASVNAGKAQAQRDHLYVTSKVIPRLGSGLGPTFLPQSRPKPQPPVAPKPTSTGETAPASESTSAADSVDSTATTSSASASGPATAEPANSASKTTSNSTPATHYTCNLCKDPACPRKKGEPRASCIHFNEVEAEQNKSSHKK